MIGADSTMSTNFSQSFSNLVMKRIDTETKVALAVLFVLIMMPLLMSGYPIYILPKYMMYGLLAMSLSIIWGFGGIVSFGQAAFFALGGYAFGIWITGTSANDFMFNPIYTGLLLSILIPGIVALLTGYFLFSGGVRGAYFVILTLALSIIVEQVAINESGITGGWNGLFISRPQLVFPFMGNISIDSNSAFYYFFALPLIIFVYAICKFVVDGKIGKVLKSIRENEDRTIALGFNTSIYKTVIFGLSGAVAGIAGAGFAIQSNFIDPTLAGVLFSTEVIVWVAIAGRYSLIAAFLGGLIVPTLTDYASALSPQYWQLGLALLFIFVVAYSKGGIAEYINKLITEKSAKNK